MERDARDVVVLAMTQTRGNILWPAWATWALVIVVITSLATIATVLKDIF